MKLPTPSIGRPSPNMDRSKSLVYQVVVNGQPGCSKDAIKLMSVLDDIYKEPILNVSS